MSIFMETLFKEMCDMTKHIKNAPATGSFITWNRAALYGQRTSSCQHWLSSRKNWVTCRPSWAMRSRAMCSPSTEASALSRRAFVYSLCSLGIHWLICLYLKSSLICVLKPIVYTINSLVRNIVEVIPKGWWWSHRWNHSSGFSGFYLKDFLCHQDLKLSDTFCKNMTFSINPFCRIVCNVIYNKHSVLEMKIWKWYRRWQRSVNRDKLTISRLMV